MAKTIDYFMAIGSPWSYLGHDLLSRRRRRVQFRIQDRVGDADLREDQSHFAPRDHGEADRRLA